MNLSPEYRTYIFLEIKFWLKTLLTLGSVIFILGCVSFFLFFIVIPVVDQSICLDRAGRNVGVSPTYESIDAYVVESIKVGSNREVAIARLEKMAPLSIDSQKLPEDNMMRDFITIKMCWYPLNNIQLVFRYTEDNHIIEFSSIGAD